jgi:hypothetical protein
MYKRIQKISKYTPSIFQGRLDMSTIASTPHTAFAMEYPKERYILQTLILMLVACFALYLYFVSSSVVHVMERKDALARANTIESTISTLENTYFTLSQGLTAQEGSHIGLVPITNIVYVHREGRVGVANLALKNSI